MGIFGGKKKAAAPPSNVLGEAFVQAAMAQMMGRTDQFESYFRQNEREIRAGFRGDVETAKQFSTVLQMAGIVALQKSRVQEGEERLREAVQLARQYPVECQLTRKLSDLGTCYFVAGKYDQGLRAVEEAVDIERSAISSGGRGGDREWLALLLRKLAQAREFPGRS